MKVLEFKHFRKGELIYEAYDLPNMLHHSGQRFILSVAFNTGGDFSIPAAYYLGLDNRSTIQLEDEIANLQNEPTGFGYNRQPVSSASGFNVDLVNNAYRATSLTVAFTASGGVIGPFQNVFLTDQLGSEGSLISTALLGGTFTINDGDSVTLRLGLSLQDITI